MKWIPPLWFQNLQQDLQEWEERSEKTKYVQRDLEDQIEEEYRKRGQEYQRVINNSNNMSTDTKPTIVVQDVLNLLKKGYTRYTKDNMGYGSIQAHYQLNGVQVKELFSHPKLKARKTILPKTSLVIIDNETGDSTAIFTAEQVLETDSISPIAQEVYSGEILAPITVEEIPSQNVVVTEVSKEEIFN